MSLAIVETIVHWVGGLFALAVLGVLLAGIWRGTRRLPRQKDGIAHRWLRSAAFYLIATLAFLALSIIFWRPLPLSLSDGARVACLVVGGLLFFPGLALLLWARLTLGRMYFVSTSFAAQLYSDHRLVIEGPFAFIRHPMYAGLIAASLGSLLLYLNWTTLGFAFFAPFVLLRARREERVLAAQFGSEWQDYCRQVPALLPRLGKKD